MQTIGRALNNPHYVLFQVSPPKTCLSTPLFLAHHFHVISFIKPHNSNFQFIFQWISFFPLNQCSLFGNGSVFMETTDLGDDVEMQQLWLQICYHACYLVWWITVTKVSVTSDTIW